MAELELELHCKGKKTVLHETLWLCVCENVSSRNWVSLSTCSEVLRKEDGHSNQEQQSGHVASSLASKIYIMFALPTLNGLKKVASSEKLDCGEVMMLVKKKNTHTLC